MDITIDKYSGFCFGVVYAIQTAEEILKNEDSLYCLGDIVHNNKEVERLNTIGLKIINHADLKNLNEIMFLLLIEIDKIIQRISKSYIINYWKTNLI